jgi:hypothetical protein
LTITEGNELGEFIEQDGTSLGQSVTRKGSQIGTIRFAANGEQPQSSQGTVGIEASSRDITKTISIIVLRTTPLVDHFEVRLEPEEIAFTETSKIFVQAKDANDQDIDFDENEKLLFYLMTNPDYGTFIDANGDTVKASPPSLPNVSYGDAREGKIRFAAVKTNPKTQAISLIRVEWQQDPTKIGEKEITILEKTLKIVMTGPREVRPLIPEEIIKLPGNQGSIIPSRAMTELRVQLTRGGGRVSVHPFTLLSNYVDRSGGHDHVSPRRPRTLDNYGSFALRQATPSQASNPFEGTTSVGTEGNIAYTASVFGDRMLFKAQSKENPLLWDTLSIAERVEALLDFAEAPVSGYWNLTGNTGHTAYKKCPNTQIEHRRNHYGSAFLVEQLQLAILDLFDWTATEEGGEEPLKLGVNDMSLEQGGLFDICGDWLPGHTYHRTGASVDIDKSVELYDQTGQYRSLYELAPDGRTFLQHLTRIMELRGGKKYTEEPIHYGFGGN